MLSMLFSRSFFSLSTTSLNKSLFISSSYSSVFLSIFFICLVCFKKSFSSRFSRFISSLNLSFKFFIVLFFFLLCSSFSFSMILIALLVELRAVRLSLLFILRYSCKVVLTTLFSNSFRLSFRIISLNSLTFVL